MDRELPYVFQSRHSGGNRKRQESLWNAKHGDRSESQGSKSSGRILDRIRRNTWLVVLFALGRIRFSANGFKGVMEIN